MGANEIKKYKEKIIKNPVTGISELIEQRALRILNPEGAKTIAETMDNVSKFKMYVKHNYIDPENLYAKKGIKSKYKDKDKGKNLNEKKKELLTIFESLWNIDDIAHLTQKDIIDIFDKTLKDIFKGYNPKEYIKDFKQMYIYLRNEKYVYLKKYMINFLEEKILKKFPLINIGSTSSLLLRRLVTKGQNNKKIKDHKIDSGEKSKSKETKEIKEKITFKYSKPKFTIDSLGEIHFSEVQIKYKGKKQISKKELQFKVGAGTGIRKNIEYKQANYHFAFSIPNNLKSKLISLSSYKGAVSCDVFIKKILGKIPNTNKRVPLDGKIGSGKIIKMIDPNGKWHVAYSLGNGRYIFGTKSDGGNKFGIRITTFHKMKVLFPGYNDIKSN